MTQGSSVCAHGLKMIGFIEKLAQSGFIKDHDLSVDLVLKVAAERRITEGTESRTRSLFAANAAGHGLGGTSTSLYTRHIQWAKISNKLKKIQDYVTSDNCDLLISCNVIPILTAKIFLLCRLSLQHEDQRHDYSPNAQIESFENGYDEFVFLFLYFWKAKNLYFFQAWLSFNFDSITFFFFLRLTKMNYLYIKLNFLFW